VLPNSFSKLAKWIVSVYRYGKASEEQAAILGNWHSVKKELGNTRNRVEEIGGKLQEQLKTFLHLEKIIQMENTYQRNL
jgi:hypothetical protein